MAWYNRATRSINSANATRLTNLFPKTLVNIKNSSNPFPTPSQTYFLQNQFKSSGIFSSLSRYGYGVTCRNYHVGSKIPHDSGYFIKFYGFTRRNYHVASKTNLYARSWNGAPFWKKGLVVARVVYVVFLVSIADYAEVPYTNRKYFLLDSGKYFDKYFDKEFERRYEGRTLEDSHPETVFRVKLIFDNIVESLAKICNQKDDRQKKHFESISWKIVVVDDPSPSFYCEYGRIAVNTGLLKQFNSDAELATIIAHQVAETVARHLDEMFTKSFLWTLLSFPLLMHITDCKWTFLPPKARQFCSGILLYLHLGVSVLAMMLFVRRRDIEADHIGLLLMASAGYDPQIAPQVYQKLDKINDIDDTPSGFREYFSSRSSAKMKAKLLSSVMEEAGHTYREVVAQRPMEGVQ